MSTSQEKETARKLRIDRGTETLKPAKKAGALRHIGIHPASNGYSVSVERDQPTGGQPGQMSQPPSHPTVFAGKTAKQDVLNHISEHLD